MSRNGEIRRKPRKSSVTINDLAAKKSGLVKVGFLAGAGIHPESGGKDGGATYAEIAEWVEFGTKKTKEYGFMRAWLKKHKEEYRAGIAEGLRDYLLGKISLEKFWSTLGRAGVRDLQKMMRDIKSPENAESTQERKGRKKSKKGDVLINNPTIDSGRLRQSVDWGKA